MNSTGSRQSGNEIFAEATVLKFVLSKNLLTITKTVFSITQHTWDDLTTSSTRPKTYCDYSLSQLDRKPILNYLPDDEHISLRRINIINQNLVDSSDSPRNHYEM